MQELEGIKAQMAAVQKKAGISEEVRKALAEKLVNALYAASGPAKVKGVLEQLQHALAEGGSCSPHSCIFFGVSVMLGHSSSLHEVIAFENTLYHFCDAPSPGWHAITTIIAIILRWPFLQSMLESYSMH